MIRRAALALIASAFLAGGAAAGPVLAPTGEMSLGDPKAKVKVVEVASASCIHCAAFNNEVFPAFKKKYIDTGRVHYTLRELLTAPTEVAAAGFITARCGGKDKYFTALDSFFHGLEEMFRTRNAGPNLLKAGAAAGLSEAQVNACLQDQSAFEALNARVSKAIADGVQSTPTFFVNGKKVAEGEVTLQQLDAAIAAASK